MQFLYENDSLRRGGHKYAQKCFLEGFVFAQDETKVSLAPSLLVTFLHPSPDPSYGVLKLDGESTLELGPRGPVVPIFAFVGQKKTHVSLFE